MAYKFEKTDTEIDCLKQIYKKYKNEKYGISDIEAAFSLEQSSQKHIIKCNDTNITYPQFFKESIEIYDILPGTGFYYLKNPFSVHLPFLLLKAAITEWPCSENCMNVDIESDKPNHIWKTTVHEIENEKKSLRDTWLYKLRWTSLGYHYQWSQQSYKAGRKSPFPDLLADVASDIAALAGFLNFRAEAGIVNYYHLNSAMCFHVDHAELAKEVPLVSISLAQSAVYLLGGPTRSEPAIPLVLNHGDVIVMSGPSRFAYHAVPKILPLANMDEFKRSVACDDQCVWCGSELLSANNEDCDKLSCRALWSYLACSRVNINVRQVLNEGQTFPEEL